MFFLEVKHSEWLRTFGINRKVIRWVFGNPIIAYTMIRHATTAGLFAPVDLLLNENEAGAGCTIILTCLHPLWFCECSHRAPQPGFYGEDSIGRR